MTTATLDAPATVETETRPWNGERCDADPVERAAWEVILISGSLNFCNHHYNEFSKLKAYPSIKLT